MSLFQEAWSIHKAGLEFNQQKSSLSHKEKALKSYYDPQSPHCFSVILQLTIRYFNANSDWAALNQGSKILPAQS